MSRTLSSSVRFRSVRCRSGVSLSVVALASLLSTVASASDGVLDPTFSLDGKVTVDRAGLTSSDHGEAVAIQPDGKIVVAATTAVNGVSNFAVTRLLANGARDTAFGTNGWAIAGFTGTGGSRAKALAIQPDGKIVVAGTTATPSASDNFALVRFTSNGSIDTSFGSNGRVSTDFGRGRADRATAVVLQPDGKIVVGGETSNPSTVRDFALARYEANGALDMSFGEEGLVSTSFHTSIHDPDAATALSLQTDGRIVAVGMAGGDFAAVRYETNGSLDPAFGIGGKVTVDVGGVNPGYANAVAIQVNGRIIAAGKVGNQNDSDFALVRLEATGMLDLSFGTGGIATTNVYAADEAFAVAVQADGKIVAAGSGPFGENFLVARYDANGVLDPSFSGDGVADTDFETSIDWVRGMAIQPDGRIIVAGTLMKHTASTYVRFDVAVARFW